MQTNERILFEARRRWKFDDDVSNLIFEVKSLHQEIEEYRIMIIGIKADISDCLATLQKKGGD